MSEPAHTPGPHGQSRPGCPVSGARARGSITVHPLAEPAISGIPVDPVSVKVLQDSFELLKPHAARVTQEFYRRLFELHPKLRGMFPSDIALQEKKLSETLVAVIDGMQDPAALRARLHALGRLHADKGVVAAQYPIVTSLLLECMAKAGGEAWTPSVDREWRRALEQVSAIMQSGAAGTHSPSS